MNRYDELSHYGIKGMKWGVRKAKDTISNYRAKRKAEEDAYRKKLKKMRDNENISREVKTRAQYRNQSLAGRVAGQGIAAVASTTITEMLHDNPSKYKYMSRQELQNHFTKLALSTATKTAVGVVMNDAMAKSASKRYDDDGKLKAGEKEKFYTKEKKMEHAARFASKVIPIVASAGVEKMYEANQKRATNEARVNKWAGRILNESLDNFVYGDYEIKD